MSKIIPRQKQKTPLLLQFVTKYVVEMAKFMHKIQQIQQNRDII